MNNKPLLVLAATHFRRDLGKVALLESGCPHPEVNKEQHAYRGRPLIADRNWGSQP